MSMSNSLRHHGVKGQQWGIRNGPPYPIENKVLSKGTRLNSVSVYNDSDRYKVNGRWMYTYSPNDKWDSKVYKGPFSYYKMKTARSWVYEHQYEVVKDLKMPTKKERVDAFIEVYKDKKVPAAKDLEKVQRLLRKHNTGSTNAQNVDCWNLKTKEDFMAAYEVFNHAMEYINGFKTTKKYADLMSSRFDAMVDDNNQGIYNDAHDPIIIFRANEALKKVGKARLIDVNEIADNYNKVTTELSKKGRSVLL